MKLYEIDQAILDTVDEETGEILDIDRLNSLQMERDIKIENVILWIKDLNAEMEAVKVEAASLTKRARILGNKIKSLKEWVRFALDGQKFKTARCSVSYRKTSSVVLDDLTKLHRFLKEVKEDWISKTAIKDAIEAGEAVDGAHVEENQSMIIK